MADLLEFALLWTAQPVQPDLSFVRLEDRGDQLAHREQFRTT
jgi:hypothetical protein